MSEPSPCPEISVMNDAEFVWDLPLFVALTPMVDFVSFGIDDEEYLAIWSDQDLIERFLTETRVAAMQIPIKNADALAIVVHGARQRGVRFVIFDPTRLAMPYGLRTTPLDRFVTSEVREIEKSLRESGQ